MSMNPLLAQVEESSLKKEPPQFEIGDTVDVHVKIVEGEKTRIQVFTGIVIARRGSGSRETFTVRRIIDRQGVERVFPVHSPKIEKIEVQRQAIVRRAKLYYLRDRIGTKALNLKERPPKTTKKGRSRSRIKARKAKAEETAAATEEKKAGRKRRRRTKKADDAATKTGE